MFFPSSYLYATLHASSGIFHFLGFQSCMEMGVEQGCQSLPTGQSILEVLSSSRAAGASVWKAAASAARRFLCDHLCLLTPCLPHQVPLRPFWCHSSGAAGFGADFLFQHSWLFLPSKQGVGLLAALLSASTACIQQCLQLCFPADCLSGQLIL